MGDDIEIRSIKIIEDESVQIDFYNNTQGESYRAFCEISLFFKMICKSSA